jgi:competence protein ComEC
MSAWLATGAAPAVSAAVSCLALSVLFPMLLALRRTTVTLVLSGALACAAGAGLASAARVAAAHAGPLPGLAGQRAIATLDVVVTADPQRLAPRARRPGAAPITILIRGRVERVAARGKVTRVRSPVLVFTHGDRWLSLLPSQAVRVTGRLSAARRGEAAAALVHVPGPPGTAARPSGVQEIADRLRDGLRAAVAGLPPNERGLVPGLVLGDTSGMPPALIEDFRTAGLTHLTAVSGANLTILLGVVLFAGRWLGIRARAAPLLGLSTMAGFLVLARPEPSLLRATVMGAVGLLALASGRRGRGLPVLCAAVVLLVLIDPWLARAYGFALSVLATAGLLILAPGWRDRLACWLPRPLAAAVAVPAAAQVACAPVVVMLSAEVSLIAVPANLLAAPAIAPATVLGVLATVTAPVAPPVAHVLGELSGLPARWIVGIAERSSALPGATLPWPGTLRGALLLAAIPLAAAALAGLRRCTGICGRTRRGLRRLPAQLLPVAAALVVAVVIAVRPTLPAVWRLYGWPPPSWLLVACDVGQGDALALNAGPRAAVVVDAGPDPPAVDRCLRRLGVRTVPYLLLTHFHADHVAGVPGVLRGRAVGEIGVGPVAEPRDEAVRVARWAREHGVPLTQPVVGEVRRVGPLTWRVLWPVRLIDEGSLPNNASLAILADVNGIRLLLTGDVEPPAQRGLLRAEPAIRADVLKVPHHGSAHQDPALLRAVGARVAVVSAGAGNEYGHPAESTVRMLRSAGAQVLRTDRDGDVAVTGATRDRLRAVARSNTDATHEEPSTAPPSGSSEPRPPWHAGRRCRPHRRPQT